MRISKSIKVLCSLVLSLMLTHLPNVAAAEMITTSAVVAELSKADAQQKVEQFLNSDQVRQTLIEQGVSPDEVNQRLANLSQTEMNNLALQVEQARAGGDILVTILIVILIIFLVKRI